jgi:hypothetical protein
MVDELTMPRQELGTAMHVRRLMNLILFEPPTDLARRCFVGAPGIEALLVHFDNSVAEQRTFCRIDVRNVSPNAIA